MKKKIFVAILLIVVVLVFGAAMIGPIMSNVEVPAYKIVKKEQNIEIRQYPPLIIAEVKTAGSRQDAIGDGFRILADFIFGNNEGEKQLSMNGPITQQQGIKIAMTAPVQQEKTDTEWAISFIMPSKFSIDTIPNPINDRIKIIQIPSKRYAVITFSGRSTEANLTKHTNELEIYMNGSSYSKVGNAKYAFYNPPWTLPFLRRNEVQFEIPE
ncbi:MAG: SOUL family heme-binding protein [Thalassobaculaceae bacterium]